MRSDEKSVTEATPLPAVATKRLSRRDLLGQAGQGALGLTLLALLGGGGTAFADPRTKLERMLPGTREIRPSGLGGPGTINLQSADPVTMIPSLPMWGDGQNLDRPEYYETLCVGDVDGDGQDELIIRGPAGFLVERFDPPTGQWKTLTTAGPALTDANGWDQPQNYQTIQCTDVDGDGVDEIVGRGIAGLECYKYDSATQKFTALPRGPFDDNGFIWSQEAHYSTIKWGDAKGIGLQFVVGRAPGGIVTWYYDLYSMNWYQPYFGYGPWPDTGSADGTKWTLPQYYETIQFADIDGDGQEELLGRSASGLEIYKFSKTDSKWEMMYGNGGILGDAGGWNQPQYYQTIQCADIDGDGRKEVIARGVSGIVAYRFNTSTGEFDQLPNGPGWSDASGVWNQAPYYSSIRFGDIDGDGAAEMIGRGEAGIQTWKYFPYDANGNTWQQMAGGNPDWTDDGSGADANGAKWDEVQYYSTIRFARTHPVSRSYWFWNPNTQPTYDSQNNPRGGPYATLIGRDKYGVQTWRYRQNDNLYREDGGYWSRTSAPLPDFTSGSADANQKKAYEALDHLIRGSGSSGNIRDTYNNLASDFATWTLGLYDMPLGTTYYGPYIAPKTATPAGIDDTAWNQVTWQVYWEMAYVAKVNDWFGNKMHNFINTGMIAKTLTVETVGTYMGVPQEKKSSVFLDLLGVFSSAAGVMLGFPGVADTPFSGVPGALSSLSGIMSVSMQIAALDNGGSWQGAYAALQEELTNSFAEATAANDGLNQAITGGFIPQNGGYYLPGDFGMIAAIGQQILDAGDYSPWVWPTTLDDVVTSISRSYALALWQTIIPIAGWFIGYDSSQGPDGQNYLYQPPSHKPAYTVWIANGGVKTNQPAKVSLDALFQSPTNASDVFPLGVPLFDVFEAQNGWPKLGSQDFGGYYGATPPAPRVLKPDVQCSLVSVKRDAKSGDVLVTASVRNKGLRGATNIAFAGAKVGNSSPLSPLPRERTRLATGKSTQAVFHFPGNVGTPGQTVVLRLQGKYKGGTFGGSFRVKLP